MNACTAVTKSSKWKCYVQFCVDDGLHPQPATEAHLLRYIGWLAEQRERKLCAVSHVSVAGYPSAVRITHLSVLGKEMPPHPTVKAACLAYKGRPCSRPRVAA